jgi:sugar lactone lactonase YvrE
LAVDRHGNLFVAENVNADITPGGPLVLKVSPQGVKTTVVRQGILGDVTALAVDDQGNLFVADGNGFGNGQPPPRNVVWKVDPQGNISLFVSAVNNPTGLALDAEQNLYVASFADSAVYKYYRAGTFLRTVIAGLPDAPYGIALDSPGNLYIAGMGKLSTGSRIYKVTRSGHPSVFFDGGPLTSPYSLVFDGQGNLYASYYNGLKIVRVAPDGSSVVFPGGCVGDDAANGLAITGEVFVYAAVNGGRTTPQPAVVKLLGIVPPPPASLK